MKNHCNGTVTQFLEASKPKGSPTPKHWFDKGGSLEIQTLDDGTQIWKYTSASGDTVSYVNNYVQFQSKYLYPDPDIADFSIGEFTGNRGLDKQAALDYLKNEGYDGIPDGYVLHHGVENGQMQLVQEDIHELFTHYDGVYYNK